MPWKTSDAMLEKRKFVLKSLQEGVNFSELCREYGVSRPVGWKWRKRFLEEGFSGLNERSRRPKSSSTNISEAVMCEIISYRVAHPHRGADKIAYYLRKQLPEEEIPSRRTINRILSRVGLQQKRPRKSKQLQVERGLTKAEQSNDVWTADGKGWWRTLDGIRCEPLTIRDEYSRHVHDIAAMDTIRFEAAKERFRQCFELYGLPLVIRTDNGAPFASPLGLHGLTKLSVWWMKLGIAVERIPPGQPYRNGGHERLHLDIAQEVESTPAKDLASQQHVLNEWRLEFNTDRPHQALLGKTPAQVYRVSPRKYDAREPEYEYPSSFHIRRVDANGKLCWKNGRLFFSKAFAGQHVGLEQVDEKESVLWFGGSKLATVDSLGVYALPPIGGRMGFSPPLVGERSSTAEC